MFFHVIFQMKVMFEQRKYGTDYINTDFEDFLELFERQETESEKYWKKVLYVAAGILIIFLLSPTVYRYIIPILLNPSLWYLPRDFIFHVINIVGGIAMVLVIIVMAVLIGACFW